MDTLFEKIDDIVVITLNRPEARNSASAAMFEGITEAYRMARADGAAAIVTRAAGKTFCVGADATLLDETLEMSFSELFYQTFEDRQGLPVLDDPLKHEFDVIGFNRWAWEIANSPVPSIALVDGGAAGGGMAMSLLHHFRFAGPAAKFTMTFPRLGLGCELGSSYLLPDIVGRQAALDLLVTGRTIGAEEALRMGLVDQLHSSEDLFEAGMAYARQIAANPRAGPRAGIEAVMRSRMAGLRSAMEYEWARAQTLWGSDQSKAAILDLLAGLRAAKGKGA